MHLKTTNQKIRGSFDEKCIKYKVKGDEKLKKNALKTLDHVYVL